MLVDTHAHLGDPAFDADRDAVFARAAAAGVARVVEIADSPDEWDRAVAIARARPGSARCTLGLHPYYADRYDDGFLARLRAALDAAPEAVGVGEIGLDYAKARVPRDAQMTAFRAILAACRDWGTPVVIHCRDAYADLVPVLEETFSGRTRKGRFWGVVHCFSGTPAEAVACAGLGFALGADGPVTYKKNDSLREAFRLAGPGVTVLETDSPYLPPQSSRGKRNEPASLVEVAAALAAVWSLTPDEAAAATSRNAADLYDWP
ncbi:MAG: TatD family hydrolase [Elusimicrobiota bacterium]|nr:TatD family hydrolase [Elusimicrobiota bacterium]